MRLWNSSWTSMAFTLQMTETGFAHKTRIKFLVLLNLSNRRFVKDSVLIGQI